MRVDLSFPCEPRFVEPAADAVAAAARGLGVDDGRADAARTATARFLSERVRTTTPSAIVAVVSPERLTVAAAGHTLAVEL